jgi:hypothetical protein
MGAELPLTRPSSHLPTDLFGLRHVSSTKDAPNRDIAHLLRGCGDRTWLAKYLQTHCGSNLDRVWIRLCTAGVLRT